MARNRGFLVTIEGIDGSGKTSLFTRLKQDFEQLGRTVHVTKVPGDLVAFSSTNERGHTDIIERPVGSNIGAQIRHLLFKDPTTHNMVPGVADLLFLADQLQCIQQDVRPALDRGEVVLADRFYDSQFAYSAASGKACPVWAHQLWEQRVHQFELEGCEPNATVLLLIKPELGLARSSKRGGHQADKQSGKAWNSAAEQAKVQAAYIDRLSTRPRTVMVDVGKETTLERVHELAWTQVHNIYIQQEQEREQSTGA